MLPSTVALRLLSSLLFVSSASAVNLFVASYDGNLTTLSLTPSISTVQWAPQKPFGWPFGHHPPGPSTSTQWTYSLNTISTFNTTTASPSWLLLNKQNNLLYLIDENVVAGNGTVVTYSTASGTPSEVHRTIAPEGGVYAVFYNSGSAMAIPHYTGSRLLSYAIDSTGTLKLLQSLSFTLPHPGVVPNRQDAPHPHETLLDPSGRFILVPDLGSDLVRIFSINASSALLTETEPLVAAPGSGPRHAAFTLDPISGNYIFYLVGEITATVTAYRVSYPSSGGMTFTPLPDGVYPSLGPGHPVPATTTGESTGVTAEIALSPDGKFVIASNRRDLSFNATTPPSDSLATWAITSTKDAGPGALDFQGLSPAGGSYPRQFAINKAGDLIAVGLQMTGRVVVFERDVDSGMFGKEVGSVEGLGGVTCIVWDE